jgi:hypothetical protein
MASGAYYPWTEQKYTIKVTLYCCACIVYILSPPYKLTPTTHTVSEITTSTLNSGRAGTEHIRNVIRAVGQSQQQCIWSVLISLSTAEGLLSYQNPVSLPYHSLPYRLSFCLDSRKLKINKNCNVSVGSILGLSFRENKQTRVFKSRWIGRMSEQLRT